MDVNDPVEMENYNNYTKKLVHHAISVEGTCTGEHGIGLGKMKFMEDQFGKDTCNLMRTIKKSLDPNNILNPGKIV